MNHIPSPHRRPLAARRTHLSKGQALACFVATSLLLATGCTQPGPTLAQAVPDLEQRTGAPLATELPWDEPSAAWDGVQPLDLRAALATALQNNRALRRTLMEVDVRRARYQDSQLPPNPMLDIAAGIPVDMGVTPVLAMLGAQVDWLWKRDALVGEADAALRSVLFEAAALTVATAIDTRAAYVQVASALEVLALSQADEQVAARVLRATEQLFEAGESRATQVNEARMAWSEATARNMEARQALVEAQTRLLAVLGRGNLDLEWRTVASTAAQALAECAIAPRAFPQDQAELLELLRDRRLDLRAADARVEGVQQRLALVRAASLPTVNLGGGWERDMEGDSAVMFEAQVGLPIFNQGQFRAAAAAAELEMARLDADALLQSAMLETWRARTALATMEHHAVQLRDVTLPAFRSNKEVLAVRATAGEAPQVQLWQSEHQENHILIELARAQRDAGLAALAFERALVGARLPAGGAMAGGDGMGAAGAAAPGAGMGASTPISGPNFDLVSQGGMP